MRPEQLRTFLAPKRWISSIYHISARIAWCRPIDMALSVMKYAVIIQRDSCLVIAMQKLLTLECNIIGRNTVTNDSEPLLCLRLSGWYIHWNVHLMETMTMTMRNHRTILSSIKQGNDQDSQAYVCFTSATCITANYKKHTHQLISKWFHFQVEISGYI